MSSPKVSDNLKVIGDLVDKIGGDVLKCIFDTLYYKSGSPKLSFGDWLKANKISNKFLKNKCHLKLSEECLKVSPIDYVFPTRDYFSLIEKVNQSMYDKHFPTDHEFRIFLTELKKFCEGLAHAHKDQTIFDKEFNSVKNFVLKFKKVCTNLLNLVETELGLDIYSCVILKNLDKKIKKITDGSFKPSTKKFISSAIKEICDSKKAFYNFSNTSPLVVNLSEALDCTEPIFENQFVKPYLTYRGRMINTEDLFNHMKSEDLNHNPLIIHGTGGSGKSTICYKIFDEWCSMNSNTKTETTTNFCSEDIKAFDLVILLQLNIRGSEDLYSMILNQIFPDSCKKCNFGSKELKEFFFKSKILFILDGFDETKEKKLITDVSELFKKNENIRIIITTRGDMLQDAIGMMDCFDAKPIQLHGLEVEERNEYIKQLVTKLKKNVRSKTKDIENKQEEFDKFLNSRKNLLHNLLNLPLIINLMFLLWFQPDSKLYNLTLIDTATKLYEEITEMMVKRIASKHDLEHEIVKSTLMTFYFSTHAQLFGQDFDTKVSERSIGKIRRYIANDLKGKVSSPKYAEYEQKFFSGLTMSFNDTDTEKKTDTKKKTDSKKEDDIARSYYYFHKTQMEYLSAEYIAMSGEDFHKIIKDFCNHVDPIRFEQILPFVAGVYSSKNRLDAESDNLMYLISDEGNYSFLWRILTETSREDHKIDEKSCKRSFCTKLANKLRTEWDLTVDNIIPAFRVLQHCDVKQLLSININLSSDFNDDMEKDVLHLLSAELSSTLCERYRKKQISVELNLKGHSVGRNKSDAYLKCLKGWSSLLHFSGCLGNAGLKLLANHKQLKILELHVDDYQMFNAIIKSDVVKLKKLKKVILNFTSFKEIEKYCKLEINSEKEVNFNFYDVGNEEDLDNSLKLISHINNGSCLMNRVIYIRCNLDRPLVEKVGELKSILLGKVTVEDCNGKEIYHLN